MCSIEGRDDWREGLEGKDKRILQSAPHIAVPVTMHCGVYFLTSNVHPTHNKYNVQLETLSQPHHTYHNPDTYLNEETNLAVLRVKDLYSWQILQCTMIQHKQPINVD